MAVLYSEADPLYSDAPLDSPVPPPNFKDEWEANGVVTEAAAGPAAADQQPSGEEGGASSDLIFSGLGAKLLRAAGWKDGTGLGKDSQGIVSAIQASEKHDRLGLGYQGADTGIVRRRHTIDVHQYVDHKQSLESRWLACSHQYSGEASLAMAAPIEVEPHTPIDYNIFCTKELVDKLFAAKAQFDPVPSQKFMQARKNANPYELIGKSIFLNRAAVKMANMDSMCDFKLTSPEDVDDARTLTFCDVCAGPGGFTEYVLWRREGQARGWGFTLREGDNDFQPWKFNRQPVTQFQAHYGVDGTGDVTKNANIMSFTRVIDANTAGRGVALMMADGGFSVEGDENFQEEHLKQLVLCQFLTALTVVKEGGSFVCKVFDLFTPFVVGLVYILYRHFDRISVFKPYTSRPANSERYIVCCGLKQRRPPIVDHLFAVNDKLNELKTWGKDNEPDFLHVVPLSTILEDEQFVQYIREQNIAQAREQTDALNLLMKYVEDEGLLPLDQTDVRRRCLKEWNLPETLDTDMTASRRESMAGRRDSMVSMHGFETPQMMRTNSMRPLASFSMPSLTATPQASTLSTPSLDEIAYTTREEYIEEQRKRAQERASQYTANSAWRRPSQQTPTPGSAPVSRRNSVTSAVAPIASPPVDNNVAAAAAAARRASAPLSASQTPPPGALARRSTAGSSLGRPATSLLAPQVDGTRINPNVRLRGQQQQPVPQQQQQTSPDGTPAAATPIRAGTTRKPEVNPLTAKRKSSSLADLEAAFMGGADKKRKMV